MTIRELLRESETMLDDTNKDCNVAKVLFYHLANKEPHQLYLMMDEEVEDELYQAFQAGIKRYICLLYTSPSPRDTERSRMPSSA